MVSIIIRTKNEERWIQQVLNAVFNQDHKDFEVIIVDNNSTDKTVEKAKKFNVKVVTVDKYLPGKAINLGIKASKGEYIAILSGHCIPISNKWLSNLLRNFKDKDVAGVYGRQEPMSFTSDSDKRDLLIAFGLDKKVQTKDSFFHNANSMIRRDVWGKHPFNESIVNIEDRVWAKRILEKGYKIVYEPGASVYHYHGIHQDGDKERCAGVINILRSIDLVKTEDKNQAKKVEEANVAAFILSKGKPECLGNKFLIEYTINHAKNSKYIKEVFVFTNNNETKKIAEKLGAKVPFLRKSSENESLDEVLKDSLEKIESQNFFPDLIAVMWPTFPFREKGYIDKMIYELVISGLDSIISVRRLFETCWREEGENNYVRLDSGNIARKLHKKIYIGLDGLGYVTYPDRIRRGKAYGAYSKEVGVVEVYNPISAIKVRDKKDALFAESIAKNWFKDK